MIEADKGRVWPALSYWTIARLLKRHFANVYVRTSQDISRLDMPCILCPNHSCRWDMSIALYATKEVLGLDPYMMVASGPIRQYPLMAKVGCFEMDTSSSTTIAASIEYSANLLRGRRERALILFSQGDYTHSYVRPLRLRPGMAHVARSVGDVAVLPAAFYYESFIHQSPDAYVSIGTPLVVSPPIPTPKQLTALIEQAMTAELDNLQADVRDGRTNEFQQLLTGSDGLLFRLMKMLDPQWVERAVPPSSEAKHVVARGRTLQGHSD